MMKPLSNLFLLFLVLGFFSSETWARSKRTPANNSQVEPTSALAKIYSIENHRVAGDSFLTSSLFSPSPKIVKAAILALGRIGDPAGIEPLSRLLNKRNKEIQELAAFSLGQIGGEIVSKILEQQVQWQKEPEVRSAIFMAIGRAGNEKSLKVIAKAIQTEENAYIVESAMESLSFLWSGPSEKWDVPEGIIKRLIQLSRQREPIGNIAALTLSRFKGPVDQLPKADLLAAATSTQSPFARAILLRVLGKILDVQVAAYLVTALAGDPAPSVAIEAAKALANQPPSEFARVALQQSLLHKNTKVVVTALESIQAQGESANSLTEAVEQTLLQSSSHWVKQSALKTLAKIAPAVARPRVLEAMKVTTGPLYSSALTSLALMATAEDMKLLENGINKAPAKAIIEMSEVLFQWKSEDFREGLVNALRNRLEEVDVGITTQVAGLAEKFNWKDFANPLAGNYQLFTSADAVEAKVSILNALAKIGNKTQVPLLESAISDNEKVVVVAAVQALKTLTGKDESTKIPLNSKVVTPLIPYNEIMNAVDREVILKTSRGDITLRMRKDAPVTAYHFLKFVKSGFYDGKSFHRIVPNFVVQGGDPRGDGFGGPGFLIRDEVSPRQHSAGMVGTATAGKDTAGCQFFFNLSPNIHLFGRYTVFAEVTRGMEVVDTLEIGDQIISGRVK